METLLTTKEVSNILCVRKKTLQEWRKKEFISFIQIGHVIRYKKEDIDELLQNDEKIKSRVFYFEARKRLLNN